MNENLRKVQRWQKALRAKLAAKNITAGRRSESLLTAVVAAKIPIPAAYKSFILKQAKTNPKYGSQAAIVSGGKSSRAIEPAKKKTTTTTGRGKKKKTTTATTTLGTYYNQDLVSAYSGQGNLFGG